MKKILSAVIVLFIAVVVTGTATVYLRVAALNPHANWRVADRYGKRVYAVIVDRGLRHTATNTKAATDTPSSVLGISIQSFTPVAVSPSVASTTNLIVPRSSPAPKSFDQASSAKLIRPVSQQ